MPLKILISAGEASGDRYAAGVARALLQLAPSAQFFGCTGPQMRQAGVRTVVDSSSLSVLGLAEVVRHIPRIYREYRRLIAAAAAEQPTLAILTDSAGFHAHVARSLHSLGIPVFQLVAPQAWAWREYRVRNLRRNVNELHCIFPFEESFFRQRGVNAFYVGHPLARVVQPRWDRAHFFARLRIDPGRPLVTLCPGSRRGEIARHLPVLAETVERIAAHRACTFLASAPAGTVERHGQGLFAPLLGTGRVRYCEGETWDAMAHADITLAASGTVTMEAALLRAPMVTYYRVSPLTYAAGKPLVNVPFYSMVNLIAQKRVVSEFIQNDMTGENLAAETLRLLSSPEALRLMQEELGAVRQSLEAGHDPYEESARRILQFIEKEER
ncbi:MAG: lipid-A-disaccharide synthase [Acidobacteria bacterium]|nr:lipid-A-disaccharide synthase [Acidobacteriota bacterium]